MKRLNKGQEKDAEMTAKPRPWPTECMHARDKAAEEIAAAVYVIQGVIGIREPVIALYKALFHLVNALRLLESVGAPTKPPEL